MAELSLEDAEREFGHSYIEGARHTARAWLILEAIKESGLWKVDNGGHYTDWETYFADLRERILDSYPGISLSLSQMYQKMRYIKRSRVLGLDPEWMVKAPPSVINRAMSKIKWDAMTGEPLDINSSVKESLTERYGDDTEHVAMMLLDDATALPSASEGHRFLDDLFQQAGTNVSWNFRVNASGRVEKLEATVEVVGEDGQIKSRERYNVVWDSIPHTVLKDLKDRLDVHQPVEERAQDGSN